VKTNPLVNRLPKHIQKNVGPVVEVLLQFIPYAGSSLSTIFGNYLTDKRIEKITEAILGLAKKVEINDIVIEKLLTESQVCELLEIHLTEIARSSDEEKVEYLKTSLNNTFTSSDYQFDDKELFINVLKGLTVAEIFMLKELYNKNDPFISEIYPAPVEQTGVYISELQIKGLINPANNFASIQPRYVEESSTYVEGNLTLRAHFESEFKEKWLILMGSCNLLDSKGLADLKNNFENKTVKEIRMKREDSSVFHGIYIPSLNLRRSENMYSRRVSMSTRTPYEGSRTDFGKAFMNYISK
jgi:hypothetical protein